MPLIALIHPHELSYFNAAAGGPIGGRRVLSDSNLDWGQGWPGPGEAPSATGPRYPGPDPLLLRRHRPRPTTGS